MPALAEEKREATPDSNLLQVAAAAASRAYAPYSEFYVGCAVRTKSGNVYAGCNLENESFPAGVCAERAALAAAMVAEGPTPEITNILIYALGSDRSHTACTPCGICRQVMNETAPDASVGFFISTSKFIETATSGLLPYGFRGHLK